MTVRRSEIAQISRKCLAQVGVAAIRGIAQQVAPFSREPASETFPTSIGNCPCRSAVSETPAPPVPEVKRFATIHPELRLRDRRCERALIG
jgi:hypothetical protein